MRILSTILTSLFGLSLFAQPFIGNVSIDTSLASCGTISIAPPPVSGGSPPYMYLLEWGDGTNNFFGYGTHTYNTDGSYDIIITVSDQIGGVDTAIVPVNVSTTCKPKLLNFSDTLIDQSQEACGIITYTRPTVTGGTPPYTFTIDYGDTTTAPFNSSTTTYEYDFPPPDWRTLPLSLESWVSVIVEDSLGLKDTAYATPFLIEFDPEAIIEFKLNNLNQTSLEYLPNELYSLTDITLIAREKVNQSNILYFTAINEQQLLALGNSGENIYQFDIRDRIDVNEMCEYDFSFRVSYRHQGEFPFVLEFPIDNYNPENDIWVPRSYFEEFITGNGRKITFDFTSGFTPFILTNLPSSDVVIPFLDKDNFVQNQYKSAVLSSTNPEVQAILIRKFNELEFMHTYMSDDISEAIAEQTNLIQATYNAVVSMLFGQFLSFYPKTSNLVDKNLVKANENNLINLSTFLTSKEAQDYMQDVTTVMVNKATPKIDQQSFVQNFGVEMPQDLLNTYTFDFFVRDVSTNLNFQYSNTATSIFSNPLNGTFTDASVIRYTLEQRYDDINGIPGAINTSETFRDLQGLIGNIQLGVTALQGAALFLAPSTSGLSLPVAAKLKAINEVLGIVDMCLIPITYSNTYNLERVKLNLADNLNYSVLTSNIFRQGKNLAIARKKQKSSAKKASAGNYIDQYIPLLIDLAIDNNDSLLSEKINWAQESQLFLDSIKNSLLAYNTVLRTSVTDSIQQQLYLDAIQDFIEINSADMTLKLYLNAVAIDSINYTEVVDTINFAVSSLAQSLDSLTNKITQFQSFGWDDSVKAAISSSSINLPPSYDANVSTPYTIPVSNISSIPINGVGAIVKLSIDSVEVEVDTVQIGQLASNSTYEINKTFTASNSSSFVLINVELLADSAITYNGFGVSMNLKSALEVSIEESEAINNEELEVLLYPNPTSGLFTIDIVRPVNGFEIKVYNMLGKKVLQSKANGNSLIIDLNEQAEGVYFILIQAGDKIFRQQIVKQ